MKPSAKVGAVAVPVALAAAVAMPAAAWADEQPAPEPSGPQAALSEPQADLGSPGAGQQSGAGPEAPSAPAADSAKAPSTALGSPSQAAPGAQGGSAPADPDPSAPGTAEGGAAAGDGADALEPASASPAPAAAKRGWDVASDGSVRYYGDDGSLHTGWLVDDSYMDYGLQRYWFGVDGVMARSRLVDAADAGWWAYATARGYVVRGRYVDPSTGYVYLADNDGRLASPGWVVSDAYGQGLQRYWVDAGAHACVPGYSPDGWDHWTTSEGYVLRGAHREGDLVYLADNDGRLASPGWVVSDAYGQGLQRYWVDAGRHAAVVGYSHDGWDHWTTSEGYVARGAFRDGDDMLWADNDGRLMMSGWLVTSAYGQGLQRYWVEGGSVARSRLVDAADAGWWAYATARGYVVRGRYVDPSTGYVYLADNDGRLASPGWVVSDAYGQGLQRYWVDAGAHACVPGYSPDGWDHWTTSEGYVLRGKLKVSDGMAIANNDGVLIGARADSSGFIVTAEFDSGIQRYYLIKLSSGLFVAKVGHFSVGSDEYYGRDDEGYVVRGAWRAPSGEIIVANNDGIILRNLNGIDIHPDYQAGIDIASIEGDFVIIKASQGMRQDLSAKAAKLADSALSSGKLVGFYHFVDTRYSAEDQADYFVKAVGSYVGKGVLALDWENNDVTDQNNLSAGPGFAKRFLDRVYAKTGVMPLIYMNASATRSYDWSSVANSGYKLWVAQYLYKYYNPNEGTHGYVSDPDRSSQGYGAWGDNPTIYQYTSTGVLEGYSGQLDFDVFYGTAGDWSKLASRA